MLDLCATLKFFIFFLLPVLAFLFLPIFQFTVLKYSICTALFISAEGLLMQFSFWFICKASFIFLQKSFLSPKFRLLFVICCIYTLICWAKFEVSAYLFILAACSLNRAFIPLLVSPTYPHVRGISHTTSESTSFCVSGCYW